MKKFTVFLFMLQLTVSVLLPQSLEERTKAISKQEMQSTLEFLSHDLLEGRAPGTRGCDLAEIYMKSLYKWMDLKPGFNNDFMQPFTLKGFSVKDVNIDAGGIPLKYIDDVVGNWVGEKGKFNISADAIFVGFGITTDLWNWDDFKNVDVRNKFIIARVNDPGMFNDKIFEGKTLTFFGRWTYHMEEAARRGAAGVLLIHTDETAGYDWTKVINGWSKEEVYLESDLKSNLKFRGWIKESSLRKILEAKKMDLDKLYAQSLKPSFKPVPLGFNIQVDGMSQQRDVLNHNVIAEIPGKSYKKIVISAHIDHLGMRPGQPGDNILNGAIDNCSAVSAMMLTARILKECQKDLYYSVVVLACNSEEAGLLGSRYYVQTCPDRKDIVANINFESTPVWSRTSDFMAIGGEFSTLEDILKGVIEKEGLTYSYFSLVNQGLFYRSDQFPFARYNIPAIWISAGEKDDSGTEKYPNFWKTDYHTVKDEYNPEWQLEGLKQTVEIAVKLIDTMNKTQAVPQWKRKLIFPLFETKK